MTMRGMHSIKGAIKEQKRQASSGGKYIRRYKLEDGETGEVILLSTPDKEPFIFTEHTVSLGKGRFTGVVHRQDKCVACHENAAGSRTVGRPSVRAGFTLYDLRWARKRRDEEKSTKERERFTYEPISEDKVTEKGKRKGIHVRRGKCGWEMPPQWASALAAADQAAGKRCKSCGKGKIKRIKLLTADGGVFKKDVDEDKLQELLASGKVVEKIECDRCDEPVRRSIFNSVVQVTRTGESTSTTYQFTVTGDDIPDDVQEILDGDEPPEAYDWEDLKEPLSPEAQARELGVKNPFRGSRDDDDDDEAESYDDDDDDDPFGDDEPKSKKKGKKSKQDDDEDDEDEDEDEEDDDEPRSKKKSRKDDDDDDDDPFSSDDDDDDEEDEKSAKKKSKLKVKSKKRRDDDDDD